MTRAWIKGTQWKYWGSTSCRLDYRALCGKWVRALLYFQRKGGETKAHYLDGLKLALKEVQVQKECSSMHVGREPEIEPTRLGFHNNIFRTSNLRCAKMGRKKWLTCLAALLQNELTSSVGRFPTHIKPVLQQIRLSTGLNMGGKTRNIAIQLVLQQCCKTSCMFLLPVWQWQENL